MVNFKPDLFFHSNQMKEMTVEEKIQGAMCTCKDCWVRLGRVGLGKE